MRDCISRARSSVARAEPASVIAASKSTVGPYWQCASDGRRSSREHPEILVKCRAELAAFEAKGRSGTVEEEDEKVIAEALGVILKSAPAQEQPLARIRRHPSSTIHPPIADLGQRGLRLELGSRTISRPCNWRKARRAADTRTETVKGGLNQAVSVSAQSKERVTAFFQVL
jgi:hypothetical protein